MLKRKRFDTAWVEGTTLVRLHEVGGDRADVASHVPFPPVTLNLKFELVHLSLHSIGIAQGRVLSPLLFNLLIDTLASDVRQLAPGVCLLSHHRFSNQLYANDPCDVVAAWARKWRFKFGVGPTTSAAMVFGPARLVPICAVTLAGVPLPQVSEHPYLGVTLTSSLTCVPHRGNRLFAQCVSWCRSEHLPLVFASDLTHTHALWGAEFCSGSAPAVRLLDSNATLEPLFVEVASRVSRSGSSLGIWLVTRRGTSLEIVTPSPFGVGPGSLSVHLHWIRRSVIGC